MHLDNQVCTIGQALQLVKLGVTAPAAFMWYNSIQNGYILVRNTSGTILPHEIDGQPAAVWAYNVAELGVMLPPRRILTYKENLHQQVANLKDGMIVVKVGGGSPTASDAWVRDEYTADPCLTEAFGRAGILIEMIANGETTAEEVNQRLNQ